MRHPLVPLASAIALFMLLPAGLAAEPNTPGTIDHEVFAPFSFAHFGDPQIGMGGDSIEETRDRFIEAIGAAQERQVELASWPGIWCTTAPRASTRRWKQAWKHFSVPVLTVPGNHDIADPATLARFRERYGRDYGAVTGGTARS